MLLTPPPPRCSPRRTMPPRFPPLLVYHILVTMPNTPTRVPQCRPSTLYRKNSVLIMMSFVQAWRMPLPIVFIAAVECARARARIFLDEHKFQFHVVRVHIAEPLPFKLFVAEDDVGGFFAGAHGHPCPCEAFHFEAARRVLSPTFTTIVLPITGLDRIRVQSASSSR